MKQQSKELVNPTDKQLFKPSANQEKWLDTAIQSETDEIAKIAEACGIDRTVWYDWLKKEGFIEWFKGEWDRRLSASGWKLDAIGMRNAKRDHKYWESMQKRVGNLHEDKSTKVLINNFIPILGKEEVQ
jgi:hypothetical protein